MSVIKVDNTMYLYYVVKSPIIKTMSINERFYYDEHIITNKLSLALFDYMWGISVIIFVRALILFIH